MISHLTGRAATWATAEWARESTICLDAMVFSKTLSNIFDHDSPAREASRLLKQGSRRVVDYAIDFHQLAADSGWNGPALNDAFVEGLSEELKDLMAPLDLPTDLEAIINTAIRIDTRLEERERDRRKETARHWSKRCPAVTAEHHNHLHHSSALPGPTSPPPASEEPMQIGRTKLNLEERRRRIQEKACFYCGEQGHKVAECQLKGEAHQPRGGRW